MTYLFLLSQQINNSYVFTPDTEEREEPCKHTQEDEIKPTMQQQQQQKYQRLWMRKQRECEREREGREGKKKRGRKGGK